MSAERIKRELYDVQESILKDENNNTRYIIPSKPSQEAVKIYKSIKKKKDVVPYQLITK
jgi:hypothetical protein